MEEWEGNPVMGSGFPSKKGIFFAINKNWNCGPDRDATYDFNLKS